MSIDFELVPVDPTTEMKQAAVEVELFDHDTGKDYTLSWEEVEEIYSAMLNAAPTPPQRQWAGLTDEDLDHYREQRWWSAVDMAKEVEAKLKEKNT